MTAHDNTQRRCLITTADEQTWVFDRPVLFLGQWCCRHARRHVWQAMDAVVAAPYGLAPAIRDRDHARAREYEAALFPHLCEILNLYHATNHGPRYWRMVLGHWFRRYIEVLINRYQTLNGCLNDYQPSSVTVFPTDDYALVPSDSYAAIWACSDARWNARLYSRLLEYMDTSGLVREVLSPLEQNEPISSPAVVSHNRLRQTLRSVKRQVQSWAMHLSRDDDGVIFNSYLPRKFEILLNLALGQFPQRLVEQNPSLSSVSIDQSARHRLGREMAGESVSGLDRAMRALLFELIPVCYLEGYAELVRASAALPWPKKPKFIFTSNNFDTDELFKAWAADKVEVGVPYIAGQHGNNYGTSRYMNPSVEELTSDKFITWGWTDGLPQHIPGFIFKTCGKSKQRYDPHGGLLLIELHAGQMLTTWDSVAEYAMYFDEQLYFTGSLQPAPRQQLTVRLHHTLQNLGWDDTARWQAYDPSVRLETGECRLSDLIAASRLVVHSYDSTGILETLVQNIPTLAFWQNGFDHLRESAWPHYQLLVDAGIVHLSPQSAAAHINLIWDDVDGWWASSTVQAARIAFCSRYARTSQHPIRELEGILMKERQDEPRAY